MCFEVDYATLILAWQEQSTAPWQEQLWSCLSSALRMSFRVNRACMLGFWLRCYVHCIPSYTVALPFGILDWFLSARKDGTVRYIITFKEQKHSTWFLLALHGLVQNIDSYVDIGWVSSIYLELLTLLHRIIGRNEIEYCASVTK